MLKIYLKMVYRFSNYFVDQKICLVAWEIFRTTYKIGIVAVYAKDMHL